MLLFILQWSNRSFAGGMPNGCLQVTIMEFIILSCVIILSSSQTLMARYFVTIYWRSPDEIFFSLHAVHPSSGFIAYASVSTFTSDGLPLTTAVLQARGSQWPIGFADHLAAWATSSQPGIYSDAGPKETTQRAPNTGGEGATAPERRPHLTTTTEAPAQALPSGKGTLKWSTAIPLNNKRARDRD